MPLTKVDESIKHLQEGIRLFEHVNNFYEAARAKFNMALLLKKVNKFEDALDYIHSAKKYFSSLNPKAGFEIRGILDFIDNLENEIVNRK